MPRSSQTNALDGAPLVDSMLVAPGQPPFDRVIAPHVAVMPGNRPVRPQDMRLRRVGALAHDICVAG